MSLSSQLTARPKLGHAGGDGERSAVAAVVEAPRGALTGCVSTPPPTTTCARRAVAESVPTTHTSASAQYTGCIVDVVVQATHAHPRTRCSASITSLLCTCGSPAAPRDAPVSAVASSQCQRIAQAAGRPGGRASGVGRPESAQQVRLIARGPRAARPQRLHTRFVMCSVRRGVAQMSPSFAPVALGA